jgi:hypothetical protein
MALHVRPCLDPPRFAVPVMDERFVSIARGLPEKNANRGSVGDRFGIELLRRGSRSC